MKVLGNILKGIFVIVSIICIAFSAFFVYSALSRQHWTHRQTRARAFDAGTCHGHQHLRGFDKHRRHAHAGLRPLDKPGGNRHRHRRPARRRHRRSCCRKRFRRQEHRQQGRNQDIAAPCTRQESSRNPRPSPCSRTSSMSSGTRMLLHACCGPCSLEPTRIFAQEGVDLTIHYANSNIFPPRSTSIASPRLGSTYANRRISSSSKVITIRVPGSARSPYTAPTAQLAAVPATGCASRRRPARPKSKVSTRSRRRSPLAHIS